MSKQFEVDPHGQYDKHIGVRGPVYFDVDYDDVNTTAVDVLLPHMLTILNEHWTTPRAYVCVNDEEDCWRTGRYQTTPGICEKQDDYDDDGCGRPLVLKEVES